MLASNKFPKSSLNEAVKISLKIATPILYAAPNTDEPVNSSTASNTSFRCSLVNNLSNALVLEYV